MKLDEMLSRISVQTNQPEYKIGHRLCRGASSYPSGHATVGTLMGIELANMLPEKRAQIMARAWEFGHNREVGGIHYPSDIEMGRIAGTVIAQTISTHPDFKVEFEAARAELRAALGL